MDSALTEHFGDIAQWSRPAGGYFFWLQFSANVDTSLLKAKASSLETGFQPGAVFSSMNHLHNYMRLSFAHYNEENILDGVARLRPLFD